MNNTIEYEQKKDRKNKHKQRGFKIDELIRQTDKIGEMINGD